jgi:hypothetical protein
MLVQCIKKRGTTYLLRKLLEGGTWLTCVFESNNGKFFFRKKASPKDWNETVQDDASGVVENITDPNAIASVAFPE